MQQSYFWVQMWGAARGEVDLIPEFELKLDQMLLMSLRKIWIGVKS